MEPGLGGAGGLRRDEANGQHPLNLDIGLPLSELRPLVRNTLVDGAEDLVAETTIAAVNRRGRNSVTEGAILVLEENRPA